MNAETPFMLAALQQAHQAWGRTSPNPPVGAVIVRDGAIVGRGYTQPPGGPHAEIMALREAGTRAQGATLYVTLEPCTIHGRTPPCTDAIIAAGIAAVVIASHDPNPRFEHGAATILAAAGIPLTLDAQATPAAHEQTAAFRRWITTKRPLVRLKYAMTLDGKIATHSGDSRWITGPAARQHVHLWRDRIDALMVGIGTLLADDPLLTTRLDAPTRPIQHPLRIVADARGRTPLTAAMLRPDTPGQTLIATTAAADPAWRAAIAERAEVITLPADATGGIDLAALLANLGERGIADLMVEGGSTLLAAFVKRRLVDQALVFVAPKVVGGLSAPTPVGGQGVEHMAAALPLRFAKVEPIGDDILLTAYPVIE